jgi:hypothetical protein
MQIRRLLLPMKHHQYYHYYYGTVAGTKCNRISAALLQSWVLACLLIMHWTCGLGWEKRLQAFQKRKAMDHVLRF